MGQCHVGVTKLLGLMPEFFFSLHFQEIRANVQNFREANGTRASTITSDSAKTLTAGPIILLSFFNWLFIYVFKILAVIRFM
jgi:hypothetical protein